MAMGTRKQREKQEDIWIAHTELASAPGHPFYQRLNELLEAGRMAIDAATLEANAAMRSIVRRDTGASYEEFLRGLAKASGIATPTREDLARLDRKRKKRTSNKEWKSPADEDARIAKMKDGRTHLAHKAEQAVYANRRRVRGEYGKSLLRRRSELVERSFAHCYETGGMRRCHLRGRENILKRQLVHVGAFNLSLILRQLLGAGTPRELRNRFGRLVVRVLLLFSNRNSQHRL